MPLAGAPGWKVVERSKQPAAAVDPQPAPEPEPRATAFGPLAAGAALSVLVLTLAFFDQGWPDWLEGGSGPVGEPVIVVATVEDRTPQLAPDPRPDHPAAETAAARDGPVRASAPNADGASAPGEDASPPRTAPPLGSLPPAVASSPPPGASALPRLAAPAPPAPAAQTHSPPLPMLRPAVAQIPDPIAPERAAEAPPGIFKAAFGEPDPSVGGAAADAGIRVFIHYTVGQEDSELARRLAAFLELRGFTVADVRAVSFPIGEAGLRYFFDRDREDSQRLLEEIDWFFEGMPERAPHQASDFTHYTPRPRPGNVEVWLPTS